ncbi:hypothetical protein B0H17DRAFT_978707 [Mycena rosella]|uniref:DUF1793-domain-containing protein n=1 Tax=Mycena rosella TaxID=1033263 RepID=A0AAD7GLY8_MYCRO|nr:hypothetical protein B0H17DRAFT_978707 [Mycena rosella]
MRPRHFLLLPFGLLQLWSSWSLAQQPQTFFPPAVPLAVRSPTFNCWLDTRNGTNPMANWPVFWNDQHTLGWAGYIKVDGLTWHWLGNPVGNASTYIGTEITPTRTIITVQAGPMLLNVTFLSPVEPDDWTRQSFPFSYMYVDGTAVDEKFHSIQLYSDISAEWVTNSFGTSIQWSTEKTSTTSYHEVHSSTPTSVFTDVAEDSVAYYAMAAGQQGLVSVIGNDVTLRPQFNAPGSGFTLTSDLATSFGNVDSSGKFPVFAHAVDLGETQSFSSIAWAVGVVRDPVLTSGGGQRRAYFWSQYSTIGAAIDAFIADFPSARARAVALDQQILQDAGAVSQQYADLVSLATRQAMAGVEITLSTALNLTDVQAFMKDVGNTQRVNPTEAIYAALPALIYLNSSLTGLLLEPLLQFQNSGLYSNPYAASDLGTAYPAAPGNAGNVDTYGVENSGNMIILVLAHASSSGDGSLIGQYYNLLRNWAEYLVTNTLIPAEQTPADARDTTLGQNSGNITNLAIKGIIAIQAMSAISQIKGESADAQKYATTAQSLAQSWIKMALSSGSLRWTYGSSDTGLMYNFFADRLLKLNVLPSSVYAEESSSIGKALPFGLPLSSDSNSSTRSDWSLFSASAAPDTATRNLLISGVHQRASDNSTAGPFSNTYSALTGAGGTAGVPQNGYASPAQGAMFSLLSLNVPNKTVIIPTPALGNSSGSQSGSGSVQPNSHKSNTGAIVGGVIAGLAAVILLGLFALFIRRRRRHSVDGNVLRAPEPYNSQPNMANVGAVLDPAAMRPTDYSLTSTALQARGHEQNGSAFSKSTTSNIMHSGSEPYVPVSVTPSASGAPSSVSQGTNELRNEMETLRREVEQLRAAQVTVPHDAPPVYE